ncbi:MAG: hypothetical protein ACOYOO_07405 [Saprospiraceae bacterium]|jgi:hypothetical protein
MQVVHQENQAQDLHFEHILWIKELDFFEGELKFFENRLGDLVMRYRSIEVLAQLEHFQNQFIRQKEVLDKLSRDIRVHEQALSLKIKKEQPLSDLLPGEHTELRRRMADFRKIYSGLKEKFFAFLAKWY